MEYGIINLNTVHSFWIDFFCWRICFYFDFVSFSLSCALLWKILFSNLCTCAVFHLHHMFGLSEQPIRRVNRYIVAAFLCHSRWPLALRISFSLHFSITFFFPPFCFIVFFILNWFDERALDTLVSWSWHDIRKCRRAIALLRVRLFIRLSFKCAARFFLWIPLK